MVITSLFTVVFVYEFINMYAILLGKIQSISTNTAIHNRWIKCGTTVHRRQIELNRIHLLIVNVSIKVIYQCYVQCTKVCHSFICKVKIALKQYGHFIKSQLNCTVCYLVQDLF